MNGRVIYLQLWKLRTHIKISLCFGKIHLKQKKSLQKKRKPVVPFRNPDILTYGLIKMWLVNPISRLLSQLCMSGNHDSHTWNRDGLISRTKTNAVIFPQWSVCCGPSGDSRRGQIAGGRVGPLSGRVAGKLRNPGTKERDWGEIRQNRAARASEASLHYGCVASEQRGKHPAVLYMHTVATQSYPSDTKNTKSITLKCKSMKSLTTFYELYISPIQEVMRFLPQQKTDSSRLPLLPREQHQKCLSWKYENVLMTRSTGTFYVSNMIIHE